MRTLFSILILMCLPHASHAMGSGQRGYTLVVIPAKYAAVQFGRDLVEQEPVMLLTYDVSQEEGPPFLHAWARSRWVRVPADAYAAGSFAKTPPTRTVVVGAPSPTVTQLVEGAVAWCPQVLNVESHEVADLVNAMGRFFNFDQREWEWWAARYELQLEDLNYGARSQSWYDSNRASSLPAASSPLADPPAGESRPRATRPEPMAVPRAEPQPELPSMRPPEDIESFSFSAE